MDERFCGNCGKERRERTPYCGQCGAPFRSVDQPESEPHAPVDAVAAKAPATEAAAGHDDRRLPLLILGAVMVAVVAAVLLLVRPGASTSFAEFSDHADATYGDFTGYIADLSVKGSPAVLGVMGFTAREKSWLNSHPGDSCYAGTRTAYIAWLSEVDQWSTVMMRLYDTGMALETEARSATRDIIASRTAFEAAMGQASSTCR